METLEITNQKENKMGIVPIKKLIWKMGIPMIISMVLQAIYNIVDTAFVINMGDNGVQGNLALTYAFPIQLLMIAIGVGTGVGINTCLSKSLGEKKQEEANKIVGNGIFLGICIYIVFLLFGIFGAKWFIGFQANGDSVVTKMGTDYLMICCCLSFGSIGFTIYERFLQSSGKTLYSTIAQIAGAVANIVLDYVFIYPLQMGITGAAYATVIGQVLSLALAMFFHYSKNKEIGNHVKYIIPEWKIIKRIYHVGISAALMQGMLSLMMLGVNLILGQAGDNSSLLQGSFGIYYKIMQFALFACFGLSNTIISIMSYNYGMKNKKRTIECLKYGIIDSLLVALFITILFECLANPIATLFGMASGVSGAEITKVVVMAIRIASIGYVFMGISLAIQGVLQAFRYAVSPLIISFLRLVLFVFPLVWAFMLLDNATAMIWWAFPIAECLTAIIALFIVKRVFVKKIKNNEALI